MMHIRFILVGIVTCMLMSCTSGNQKQATEKTQNAAAPKADSQPKDKKNILFFGDSLTAGYGLESQEEAFPAWIQRWIDSLALPYQVVNGGLSGETTAAGNERIDWLLEQGVDVLVLELGANDGLRGIDPQTTRENLEKIIAKVKAANPEVRILLAGMQVPPSMGADYASRFKAIFPALADKHHLTLIPFLLEGVAGDSTLNQQDGIHPTSEGQKILAENVWNVLQPLL